MGIPALGLFYRHGVNKPLRYSPSRFFLPFFLPLGTLWLISFSFILFGLIFGKERDEGKQRIPKFACMCASGFLLLSSWLSALCNGCGSPPVRSFQLVVAIGMTFSWIGDMLLAKLLIPYHPVSFPLGMISFGIGYFLYGLAYFRMRGAIAKEEKLSGSVNSVWGSYVLTVFLSIALWLFIMVYADDVKNPFNYIILLFSQVHSWAVGSVLALLFRSRFFVVNALGATSLVISDAFLGVSLFAKSVGEFHNVEVVVWVTYWVGQFLTVSGLVLANVFDSVVFSTIRRDSVVMEQSK